MNLRYGGRPVSWFGVGAAPDAIGSGIAALQTAVAQYSGSANFGGTVASLQAAGNAAVGAVGPAIDALSGNDPTVMRVTQQAWQLNSRLAGVNSSGATGQADVSTAKEIVNQMIVSYQQAARLAASLQSKAPALPGGASAPNAPPPSTGLDTTTWVAIGFGVFALVAGGVIIATTGRVT